MSVLQKSQSIVVLIGTVWVCIVVVWLLGINQLLDLFNCFLFVCFCFFIIGS